MIERNKNQEPGFISLDSCILALDSTNYNSLTRLLIMEIKENELTENILVFYVQAESFPQGITESFNKLDNLLGNKRDHHIYGITLCDGDKLIYRACAKENFEGEATTLGLPIYTIPKGKYLYATLNKWLENLAQIPGIFDELMKQPNVKEQTICLEDYTSADTMLAMVQHA